MVAVGRICCVALPFALTVASIICILIVMLAGITDKNLDLFEIDTQNLSISSSTLQNAIDLKARGLADLTTSALNGNTDLSGVADGIINGENLTAKDLGLAGTYKVFLWNYCGETDGTQNCSKSKFDWAHSSLNTTDIERTASATGVQVEFPKEVTGALKTFAEVSKWTQVVYIIAILAAAVEILFGVFAICSRVGSCCTFIVSGIATLTVVVASILATVQASVVVGSVKATAEAYGVDARFNTGFLTITWLAVAFSIAAGLFWLFSTCCCGSSHASKRQNRQSRGDDHEKLVPTGSYQRVDEPVHYNQGYAGQQSGVYGGQEYGVPMHHVKPQRGNGAYEPYAHTAV